MTGRLLPERSPTLLRGRPIVQPSGRPPAHTDRQARRVRRCRRTRGHVPAQCKTTTASRHVRAKPPGPEEPTCGSVSLLDRGSSPRRRPVEPPPTIPSGVVTRAETPPRMFVEIATEPGSVKPWWAERQTRPRGGVAAGHHRRGPAAEPGCRSGDRVTCCCPTPAVWRQLRRRSVGRRHRGPDQHPADRPETRPRPHRQRCDADPHRRRDGALALAFRPVTGSASSRSTSWSLRRMPPSRGWIRARCPAEPAAPGSWRTCCTPRASRTGRRVRCKRMRLGCSTTVSSENASGAGPTSGH